MKNMIIKRFASVVLVVIIVISVLAMSGGFYVYAAPDDIPYNITQTFNGDPHTQKGICWSTNTSVTGSTVQVVPKVGSSPNWSSPMEFNGTYTTVNQVVPHNVHKALVKGLNPGASYWYRVGDKAKGLWSEAGTVKTEPANSSKYTALVFADTQFTTQEEGEYGTKAQRRAFAAYPDAAFAIHVGDIVNNYNNDGDQQVKHAFSNGKDFMMNYTYAPATGNHDVGTNSNHWMYNLFNLSTAPNLPTAKGVDYSFDYGDVHYIVLNTNGTNFANGLITAQQRAWVKADAAGSKKKFKVLICHIPPCDPHSNLDNLKPFRNIITAIIDDVGIDLVLSGHNHVWCKTKTIKGFEVVSETKKNQTINGETFLTTNNPGGTVYLEVASSGFRNYNGGENYGSAGNLQGLIDYSKGGGAGKQNQSFVRIEVDGNKMGVVGYNQTYSTGAFNEVFRFGILKGSATDEPGPSSSEPSSSEPSTSSVLSTSSVPSNSSAPYSSTNPSSSVAPSSSSETSSVSDTSNASDASSFEGSSTANNDTSHDNGNVSGDAAGSNDESGTVTSEESIDESTTEGIATSTGGNTKTGGNSIWIIALVFIVVGVAVSVVFLYFKIWKK